MKIYYAKHLEKRIALRNIPVDLPKRLYEEAKERFADTAAGHVIAVGSIELYGKKREVMIAYIEEKGSVTIITCHPLKRGQKANRIAIGRWKRL